MTCTFCGNENQPGTRFCGMCGVRLERRNAERRITEGRGTKCPSCGHLNEPRYKFCGMCGLRIDRRLQDRRAGGQKFRANAMANAQLPTPEMRPTVVHRQALNVPTPPATVGATALAEHMDPQVEEHRVPATLLGGPSFLGLNEPQTDSEYLLEEEGSSRGGIRTLVLLVILLAIGGLIYVQYRSNLSATPKPPDLPKPNPALVPEQHGKDRQSSADKGLATIAGASNLQAAAVDLVKKAPSGSEDSSTATEKAPKAKETLANGKIPAPSVGEDTGKGKHDRARPDSVVETKNEPSPSLIKARKYLHGQGVRQSCEQGLVYLQAATRENDPQAAVQMAALYASGSCVQQDRVKAYQWFTTAQEMNPDNRWIAKNMGQLWAQMTPQERRQIR